MPIFGIFCILSVLKFCHICILPNLHFVTDSTNPFLIMYISVRANCAAFLSRTEEYDEEVGLTRDIQSQAEAILFPASELNSSLLKLAGDTLNSEELLNLADQETPTALNDDRFNINDTLGGNNLLRDKGLDSELEDYNDVSSMCLKQ